jgi:hypothetical protein
MYIQETPPVSRIMTNHFYTIDDFQKLSFLENQYTLPQSVLDIFRHIEGNLEITESTTPVPSVGSKTFTKKSGTTSGVGSSSGFSGRHSNGHHHV